MNEQLTISGSNAYIESPKVSAKFTYKWVDKTAYQTTLNFYSFFIFLGLIYAYVRLSANDFKVQNFFMETFVRIMLPFNSFICFLIFISLTISFFLVTVFYSQEKISNYIDNRKIFVLAQSIFMKMTERFLFPVIDHDITITVYRPYVYGDGRFMLNGSFTGGYISNIPTLSDLVQGEIDALIKSS